MTLTSPIPIQQPARHHDITVQCRVPDTGNGLSWHDTWIQAQARLEQAIIRTLQPTPWSILDGITTWTADRAGGPSWMLTGVWRQQ